MLQKLFKIARKIKVIGLARALRVVTARLVAATRNGSLATQYTQLGDQKSGQKRDQVAQIPPLRSITWVYMQNNTSLYIAPQMDNSLGRAYPWHEGYEDMAQTFHKDIPIPVGQGPGLACDIKTPWEYSRFLWAPPLALAYCQMGDSAHKKRCVALMVDWIDSNPYLLGINWLCPMEVALRAINWIISYTLIASDLDQAVRRKFVNSLYDHMIYLERNWELADGRTSNHYLSDLVGYLYLAWFFDDRRRQQWVIKEIEQEMAWQIFDEGTSYEGSTAYHRLVTELFVHADLMARECGFTFSEQFHQKLIIMKQFISWCGDIKIGDDDSGRVTMYDLLGDAGASDKYGMKSYEQFGLSIIKTPTWHITLRHPTYHQRQPTGHFHEDAGSFTLTYNGIPIFVDPGSYVYTPSSWWRDYFRSAAVHNKFYQKNDKHTGTLDDMFTLRLPPSAWQGNVVQTKSRYIIETYYFINGDHARTVNKKFECDTLTNSITISDTLTQDSSSDLYANLTAAPGISFERTHDGWVIMHNNSALLVMRSDLDYQPYNAWVAPCYGQKIETVGLCARVRKKNHTTYLLAYHLVARDFS